MSTKDKRTWLFLLLLLGANLAGPALVSGDPAPSLSTIAGSYYEGDGMVIARTLVIRPDGTFQYEMEGGARLLQAQARGTACPGRSKGRCAASWKSRSISRSTSEAGRV